jgi:hypothetical protein
MARFVLLVLPKMPRFWTTPSRRGNSEALKRGFLQSNYTEAQRSLEVSRDNCWKPAFEYPQAFWGIIELWINAEEPKFYVPDESLRRSQQPTDKSGAWNTALVDQTQVDISIYVSGKS